ncbi:sensor domain-containing diguanylate cyclase [Andreprevotia chitinilytica]|uniref:sensor domain-containing diguanylate cyclase n=1 Tax=Andreprevotia chitinilytica TaxID=396808 RepID=UPI00054D59C0|nr:sensor domain-containing diguanylate cyclase [Andreprevotia chitinilytica]
MQPGTHSSGNNIDTMGVALIDFFDVTPTSLWLEDYSKLYDLFETWRAQGVADLRRHLEEDPRRIAACSACIQVLKVNQRTLSLYGARSFDELAANLDLVLRDDMLEAHLDELLQLWNGKLAFQSKSVNYTLDGRRLDILLKGVILPGHEARWDGVLVAVDDITELEDARRRAIASDQYARGVFEYAPVSLWVENFQSVKHLLDDVRAQGITDFRTFTDVHPEFVERCMAEIQVLDVNHYTLGLFKAADKAALLGRLPEIFRDDMRAHFREQLLDLWDGRLFQQREVVNYGLDGEVINVHLQFSVFPGHEKNWDLVLLALTDITARKKAESYLEFLGKHDVLTKLKNRSFYVDELNRLERKGPFPVTVIMIDLNDLKTVNDQLGHAAGDALLRRAGEVLIKAVDKPLHAARIGGDEFALLLPGADTRAGEMLMDNIRQLIELNNQFYTGPALSLSMGCATCHNGERLESALRQADAAMYEDKRGHYEGTEA